MKKYKGLSILLSMMMLCTVLVTGCTIFPEEEAELEPPIVLPKEISYRTKEAVRGDIQNIQTVAGEVVPIEIAYQYVTLKGSRLEEVLVKLGQSVEAGDPVIKFVTGDLETQIETAELRISAAQFDYDTALQVADIDGVLEEQTLFNLDDDIASMSETLTENKDDEIRAVLENMVALQDKYDELVVNYDYYKMQKDFELYQLTIVEYTDEYLLENPNTLSIRAGKINIINTELQNAEDTFDNETQDILDELGDMRIEIEQLDYDIAEDNADQIAQLQYTIDQQSLSIQKNLLNRLNSLNMKKLSLELDRLALRELYNDLNESIVKAEIAGDIVYIRDMEEGDTIYDFDKLIGIANESDYRVEYEGTNADVFNIGMAVIIEVDKVPYSGTVTLTADSVPEEQKSDYKDIVMFDFDELPEGISRGTNVSVKVILEEEKNVVIVPKTALFYAFDNVIIYVLEDGVKKERYVEVGIENATEAQIIKGVEAGDLIILN
ncbi:MAG: hypothetical protein PF505_04845 [Vallitaleaceae bacterium]|jgi:multidrug efflux pump subunit AcrA (membrane-fusion protein)|nr:hypothetical protein [Vallitaleaceae bacterium]